MKERCLCCGRKMKVDRGTRSIRRATGMVMVAYGVEADEAYRRIVRWARSNQLKSQEVVDRIVAGKIDVTSFA